MTHLMFGGCAGSWKETSAYGNCGLTQPINHSHPREEEDYIHLCSPPGRGNHRYPVAKSIILLFHWHLLLFR